MLLCIRNANTEQVKKELPPFCGFPLDSVILIELITKIHPTHVFDIVNDWCWFSNVLVLSIHFLLSTAIVAA